MTINFYNAEMLGKELQKDRLWEAEHERLIKVAAGWNPSPAKKLLLIFRTRLNDLSPQVFKKKGFIPLSQVPKNSPSM